jgi:hypothetical protein
MVLRILPAALLALVCAASASAQQAPRRHFITISYDWQFQHALDFASHPIADLIGRDVREVHLQPFQFESTDGRTRVRTNAFGDRTHGVGITLYPFGMSRGATLAVRGSVSDIPAIRLAFDGPAPSRSYVLTDGRAYDIGAGVVLADLSPGWGLGSRAFLIGGLGRLTAEERDGRRYFAEGGGGLSTGPIGVEVAVTVAWNRLTDPVPHTIVMIPVSVRGTLTF